MKQKKARDLDQELCPIPVGQKLGVSYRKVAAAMRDAGVTRPLTMADMQAFRSGAEMPAWLADLNPPMRIRGAAPKAPETDAADTGEPPPLGGTPIQVAFPGDPFGRLNP